MNNILKNKKFYFWLIICAGIVLAIVLNLSKVEGGLSWLWNAFYPVFLGLCIAFILNILMDFFRDKIFKGVGHSGLKTGLSLLCSLIVIVLIVIALIWIIVPQLIDSFKLLAQHIPGAIDQVKTALSNLTKNYPQLNDMIANTSTSTSSLDATLTHFFKTVLPNTLSETYTFAASSVKSLLNILIAVLFSFYVLLYKKQLARASRGFCYSYFSKKNANRILYAAHLLNDYFKAFIFGRVASAICFAVIYVVLALILRIPYTLMMAALISVFTIIPLFGALIAWIIGAFLIATNSILSAVIFTVIFVLILLVVRNLIYPKIIGEKIGLPDFWVLFAIIVGGKLFGLPGMLTAVPVFALIYTLVNNNIFKRVSAKPEGLNEVLTQPNWENYNPETDEFENKPVDIKNPLRDDK